MSEENKGLVSRYYGDVLNGRNLDAVGDYFADERVIRTGSHELRSYR